MSKTPSIAVIPSGYKASKVYSVLPTNGDADLDFTRNCVATRVNQNGLLEEVGLNVPRLDYSDGGCPSLLLEPQRTNLITQSNVFDMSDSLTDGTRTQITLSNGVGGIEEVLTSSGRNFKQQNINTVIGEEYTVSFFIDEINFDSSDANSFFSYVTNESGSGIRYGDLIVGKNHYTYTATLSSTTIRIGLGADSSVNPSSVKVGGLQLEEGSYVTSLIDTNGATVTRFQDQSSKYTFTSLNDSTANDFTLFLEKSQTNDSVTLGSDSAMVLFENSSSANLISIERYRNDDLRIYNYVDGVYLLSGQINYSSAWKLAIKRQGSIFSIFIDGNLISTYTEITPLTDIDSLLLRGVLGVLLLKDLRVYNEALTDSELITLTQ